MKRVVQVVLVICWIASYSAYAGIFEQGKGFLFGDDHVFYFTAPHGWVLDNASGVAQGLHMVFYPSEHTWANSPVIAYGRSVTKDAQVSSIDAQVQMTIQAFHAQGSSNYQATQQPTRTLPNGKQVAIYYFEGEQWGNYEAVGYIDEHTTINFLVFNARTKTIFDQHLPAFFALLETYQNAYSQVLDDTGICSPHSGGRTGCEYVRRQGV